MSNCRVILKNGKEEAIFRFHPWVFSGAIAKIEGNPKEGDVVKVFTSKGDFCAIGHYQIGSIAVRIFSFKEEEPTAKFWNTKLNEAYQMRKAIGIAGRPDNNTYRLIHGEGDGIPGCVIDIYGKTAVMQAHSVGIHNIKDLLAKELIKVMGGQIENVYYKSETTLPYKADADKEDGYLIGSANEADFVAIENGLKFKADWLKGQKTGFFVDQRDNRALLERYSKDKDVLNMFCYTDGSSFYAMRGGAKSVTSVDSSAKAIELTKENVELNFPGDTRHKAEATDAFKFLDDMKDGEYDLIILDPPAFAKHRDVLKRALAGYKKLNAKAFEKIRKGGILFTFSCSQAVNKEQFRLAVFSAAAMTGRNVRILHQLTQPSDHPVNIYHPEGEYLKGLVLYVE
ncbi:MAG: class I SAM-dependent rRNA methyltransferase [Bacteroidales bacterium]|nr:class I SAM-dependent rRNA methyltransferase [Candidatus Scybalocola fimicaballi]